MSQAATAIFAAAALSGWLALVLWALNTSRLIDKGGK